MAHDKDSKKVATYAEVLSEFVCLYKQRLQVELQSYMNIYGFHDFKKNVNVVASAAAQAVLNENQHLYQSLLIYTPLSPGGYFRICLSSTVTFHLDRARST